jgi:hypothetical protein
MASFNLFSYYSINMGIHRMRSILIVIMLLLSSHSIFGQEKYIYGIKINPSTGYINSTHFNKNLEAQKALDPQITRLNSNARLRANFGFGFFFEYRINDKMGALAELTYNLCNTRILINYENTNLDSNRTGDIYKIASEANIHLSYVNLPLLFKYTLNETRKFYAIAGPAINITRKPYLKSHETSTFTSYSNGTVDNTLITTLDLSARMDKYKTLQLGFVIGAGKVFRFSAENNLYIDFRYSLPVSRSEMYTTSAALDEAMQNNVFGISGKNNAEAMVTAHKLNNFKLSVLTLSIGCNF